MGFYEASDIGDSVRQSDDGNDTNGTGGGSGGPGVVTVESIYTLSMNWNYYIKNDDPGQNEFAQDDVPCTGAESPSYLACIHAAEKRRISLSQQSSCTGITVRDFLDSFQWVCDDQNGSVEIYSTGLARGRGLGDLIDGGDGTWRPNHILIEKDGQVVAQSEPAVWWNNPLIRLDSVVDPVPGTKPVELETTHAVYYVPTSYETSTGYVIMSDHISVVVLPGAVLSYADSADDVSQCDGRGAIASSALCLVFGRSRHFIWLEGAFAGDTLGRVEDILVLGGSEFAVFRNIDVSRAGDDGISLRTVSHSLVSDVVAHDNGDVGVTLHWSSIGTTLERIEAHNNGSDGIRVHDSHGGILRELTGTNNGRDGVRLEVTSGNQVRNIHGYHNTDTGFSMIGEDVVYGVTVANNGGSGMRTNGNDNAVAVGVLSVQNMVAGVRIHSQSSGNFLAATTVANNALEGVGVNFSPGSTILSLLSMNNRDGIAIVTQSDQMQVYESTLAFNGTFELRTDSNNGYYENVRLSAADDCSISGVGNNVEFGSSICRLTDTTPLAVVNPTNSPVGKVAVDAINATPLSGGVFLYDASTVDWSHFENRWRMIGLDGGLFPQSNQQGRCTDGMTCRIWDWSIQASDAVVRNATSIPDGNASAVHYWVAANATECDQHNGVWDQPTPGDCTSEFLLNAYERFDDNIGNENGLCESNESCVYLPNHGAYQGSGGFVSGPAFVDGASIVGVMLYSRASNGTP